MALCSSGLLLLWRFFRFWPLLHRLTARHLTRLSLPSPLAWRGSWSLPSARFGWPLAPSRIGLRRRSPAGVSLRLRQTISWRQLDFEFDELIPLRIGSITLGNSQ